MNKILIILLVGLLLNITTVNAEVLGSEFTYQGELKDSGDNPLTGTYDFKFVAYDGDDINTATILATFPTINVQVVQVINGVFTTQIDFGDITFSGDKVWMQIQVGLTTGSLTTLSPLQPITAAPYAIHAQFVGADAVSGVEIINNSVDTIDIKDGTIINADMSNSSITSNKIVDATIQAVDLAVGSVTHQQILDGTIINADYSFNSITGNKIIDNTIKAVDVDSTQVQERVAGSCSAGQFITAVAEDGTVTCSSDNNGEILSICKKPDGSNGVLLNNICILDYDNTESTVWNTAVNACISQGADLCTASQYYQLTDKNSEDQLFYDNNALWSNDFSDDDANVKYLALKAASDDPTSTQNYSYGCCQNIIPQPFRSNAEIINGVLVTYKHTQEDTTWRAASKVCSSLGSDLCSKSQYVALNDNSIFSSSVRRATSEMSDNDGELFDGIVGSNASDNGFWFQKWAYACCGTTKPTDLSCPGTQQINGLCTVEIHNTEDVNFLDAARACTTLGADICSKSQMQALRNIGEFSVKSWTRDGADNDSNRAGGLLGSQTDNPNPNTDQFGYACCL